VVISSVGSDPQTVDAPFVARSRLTPRSGRSLSATCDDNDEQPMDPWIYKVIEADPADFPGFTSTSVLTATSHTARPLRGLR